MDTAFTTQIEEEDNGRLEIDAALNEDFGRKLQHHWIDGFAFDLETNNKITTDLVQYLPDTTVAPMSYMVAKTINGKTSMRLLRASFDSGGSATIINN